MKKILLSLLFMSGLFGDGLGVEVGGGVWKPTISGYFQNGDTKLDLKDNLGLDKEQSNNYYYVLIDHPIPVVPNIKVIKTNIKLKGSKVNKINVSFADHNYSANIKLDTILDMTQTDYILYYRILDGGLIPYVHLSIGLAAKHLQGQMSLKSKIDEEHKKKFNFYIPMGYGKLKLDTSALFLIPVDLEYEILKISALKNSFIDEKYGLSMSIPIVAGFDIVLSGGMRKQDIVIKTDDIKADIENHGYYFGGAFNF